MELKYHFPNLPGPENMNVLVSNGKERIKASLLGPYSLKAWFFVKLYYFSHDKAESLADLHGGNAASMYLTPIPKNADLPFPIEQLPSAFTRSGRATHELE